MHDHSKEEVTVEEALVAQQTKPSEVDDDEYEGDFEEIEVTDDEDDEAPPPVGSAEASRMSFMRRPTSSFALDQVRTDLTKMEQKMAVRGTTYRKTQVRSLTGRAQPLKRSQLLVQLLAGIRGPHLCWSWHFVPDDVYLHDTVSSYA